MGFRAVAGWSRPGPPFENAGEVTLISESAEKRGLDDRRTVPKKLPAAVNTPRCLVRMRGAPDGLRKGPQ
jgi:hypothetical protein